MRIFGSTIQLHLPICKCLQIYNSSLTRDAENLGKQTRCQNSKLLIVVVFFMSALFLTSLRHILITAGTMCVYQLLLFIFYRSSLWSRVRKLCRGYFRFPLAQMASPILLYLLIVIKPFPSLAHKHTKAPIFCYKQLR